MGCFRLVAAGRIFRSRGCKSEKLTLAGTSSRGQASIQTGMHSSRSLVGQF